MRKLNSRLNVGSTLVKALSGKWVSIAELGEILSIPSAMVYSELCQLTKLNGSYVLLLRDGASEPRVLIVPVREWENLLHYLALLPRAA